MAVQISMSLHLIIAVRVEIKRVALPCCNRVIEFARVIFSSFIDNLVPSCFSFVLDFNPVSSDANLIKGGMHNEVVSFPVN